MRKKMIFDGGAVAEIDETDAMIHITLSMKNDGKGLYKGKLSGAGGTILIGTLSPEGEQLVLRRAFSREKLLLWGCYPVLRGEVFLSYPFKNEKHSQDGWRWCEEIAPLFHDPVLARSARSLSGGYYKNMPDGWHLAVPFSGGREMPLMPIFCFAQLCQVQQRTCVMWQFDAQANPIMPSGKEKETGIF